MSIGSLSADVRPFDPAVTMTSHWRHIAEDTSAGSISGELLREKGNRETWRVRVDERLSVIVKLWRRPGIRGALSRLARVNTGYREWRALNLLASAGCPAPRPLAYVRLNSSKARHDEALISEDLGHCRNAVDHAGDLLTQEDHNALDDFEDALIRISVDLVALRILDLDHRVANFVVTPQNQLMRLDFELARRVSFPTLAKKRYGSMIGVLIGTYVIVVQPDLDRATSFARRLVERMCPPKRVLSYARTRVEQLLSGQLRAHGIDSRLELPW